MNFALFRKYRYEGESSELEEIYNQVVSTWLSLKAVGCNELYFYLSDTEPKTFFGMSLWFNLEQLETFCRTRPPLLGTKKVELIEQHTFELMQDYRRVSEKPEASFIRLLLYPDPISIEQFIEATVEVRTENHKMPGFIAEWNGRSLTNHKLILSRIDWSSQEDLQAFLAGEAAPGLARGYFSGGAQIENASYDLQAVFPFKPVLS